MTERRGKAVVATVLVVVWLAIVLAIAGLVDSPPIGIGLIVVVSIVFIAGHQSWRDRPPR